MSDFIQVLWANTHNLNNVDIKIPKWKMVVITWVSWSWKSSLAFNTIYSTGQKKYLESLSSYARMFIWWMTQEADVREITGLSPTISIDQKTVSNNPRSTVWTITEIYDYFKLLFLHLWERKCIKCWSLVKKDSIMDILSFLSKNSWKKFLLKTKILDWEKLSKSRIKEEILSLWFIRFEIWWKVFSVNDDFDFSERDDVFAVVDRLVSKDKYDDESGDSKRVKDSLEVAFSVWKWKLEISFLWEDKNHKFSNIFVCSNCWHIPQKLTISSFSFNSHNWACEACSWMGEKISFSEEKIINPNLSIEEWAIVVPGFNAFYVSLLKTVWEKEGFRTDIPYKNYPQEIKDLILYWNWKKYNVSHINWKKRLDFESTLNGLINVLNKRYFSWEDSSKLDDYASYIKCYECSWHRLNKESLSVFLEWKNIWEWVDMPADEILEEIKKVSYSKNKEKLVKPVLKNIVERIEFLCWVGLSYITLSRRANTLSWWEWQRIRLATQIWTKLEGIIYVLDEPSIWLHPRDNDMLINNLKKLRDIWNTLIIVEHDEDIMREADHIIDIWPWAWVHWWNVIFEWTFDEIIKSKNSVTWPYLSWEKEINISREKRKIWKKLKIRWAKENNLKNVNVDIPLSNLVVVTWVSWSWKSSLINDILANYLTNTLNRWSRQVWQVDKIEGVDNLDKVVVIDQSPIWKTPRSNPATYTWVFTHIREIFSQTQEAKIRWYAPWRFSFNTKWWRCDACDWDWVKKVEMHFLPPVYVTCEECLWTRYNRETLSIKYRWKTISEVLDTTIEDALEFFENHPKVKKILSVLNEVWLWYVKLWQSSLTLSWWEAQRIKLATELSKRSTWKTFYILDEPTTGLHFQDVDKLLHILHSLVDKWNSVLVIEHNMNVIMNWDYIIDIWKEWWNAWWNVVCRWNLKDIMKNEDSYTWKAIKKYLDNFWK